MPVSTMQVSKLTLQSSSAGGVKYTLQSSYAASNNGFLIVVQVSEADMNAIKALRPLAIDINSTFVSLTAEFIADVSGAPVLAIVGNNGLQAAQFTADSTRPILRSFNFSLDPAVLALSFSETVDLRTLRVGGLMLGNAALSSEAVWLEAAPFNPQDASNAVTINLVASSSNAIKALITLGKRFEATWLVVSNSTVMDMSGNMVMEIVDGSAQQVASFQGDLVAPVLLGTIL